MKQFLLTLLVAVLFSLAALGQALQPARVIVPLTGGTQSITLAPDTFPTAWADQSWISLGISSASTNNGSQSGIILMVTVAPSSTPRNGVINLTGNSGMTIEVVQTTTATTVSGASFSAGKLVANGLASVFGTGFANQILGAQTLPLPTTLGGVSVKIINNSSQAEAACKLLFISPTQINLHIPANLPSGTYTILTTNADGSHASGVIALTDTAPDIFTVNQRGTGNPALILQVNGPNGNVTYVQPRTITDGTNTWAEPINLNVQGSGYLLLFTTGIGANVSLAASYIRINGTSYPLIYAGPQGQFAGLDQVAFAAPVGLPSGNYTAELVINGKAANTVVIPIQ